MPNDKTSGNGNKLRHKKFKVNIRKNLITAKMTDLWNRLPREIVESASLKIFKSCLHIILDNVL